MAILPHSIFQHIASPDTIALPFLSSITQPALRSLAEIPHITKHVVSAAS